MRGEYVEFLRGIEAPALMRSDATKADVVRTLNGIAEVGTDAVCFQLEGLSPDGASFADEAGQRLRAVMGGVNWRRMNAICKVFGEEAPEDAEFRLRATRTVAAALREANDVVYWVDGPNCEELVGAFKELAPDLVVAAREGAPVAVVTDPQAAQAAFDSGTCAVLVGTVPDAPTKMQFIAPGDAETYALLDNAYADPIESQPWTPDNSVLSEEERADGWVSLFDGKSLDGWTLTGSNKGGYAVRDGAIQWIERGGGYVRTRDRYDNFVLRLEWRIAEGGNSGISLRVPRAARFSKIGIEFQLRGDYGAAPHKGGTGAIYDVVAPRVNASRPAGEWNELEITLDGPKLDAVLNGEVVLDLNLDENEELRHRLRRGFITFQDHGHEMAFRKIRIKPL